MTPYRESGDNARLLLIARQCSPAKARREHDLDTLRRYKLAIHCLCMGCVILTPAAGAVTRSPEAALAVAVAFVVLIIPLEVLGLRLRRRIRQGRGR
ncbi:MAG: hypothetical protein KF754_01225 [Planctomycetes bacterium]|nr:hypothetical protein [Planctomycetota bacterium]